MSEEEESFGPLVQTPFPPPVFSRSLIPYRQTLLLLNNHYTLFHGSLLSIACKICRLFFSSPSFHEPRPSLFLSFFWSPFFPFIPSVVFLFIHSFFFSSFLFLLSPPGTHSAVWLLRRSASRSFMWFQQLFSHSIQGLSLFSVVGLLAHGPLSTVVMF